MADNIRLSAEEQRIRLAEEMWLCYFNQTLFDKGIISESERNRMTHLISSRKPLSFRKDDLIRP